MATVSSGCRERDRRPCLPPGTRWKALFQHPLPHPKQKRKDPGQDLFQIHHQERDHDHRFRCDRQFGHDPSQTESTFALAELALNRYPVDLILMCKLLLECPLRPFARSAQRWTRHPNPVRLAVASIVPRAIQLVHMHRLRIKTKPLTIPLDLLDQITGLIVRIPPDLFDEAESLNQTHRNLGPEFHRTLGFAANDRTKMRLIQTDNPVRDPMRPACIHRLLLTNDFLDHQKQTI